MFNYTAQWLKEMISELNTTFLRWMTLNYWICLEFVWMCLNLSEIHANTPAQLVIAPLLNSSEKKGQMDKPEKSFQESEVFANGMGETYRPDQSASSTKLDRSSRTELDARKSKRLSLWSKDFLHLMSANPWIIFGEEMAQKMISAVSRDDHEINII